MQIFKKTKQTQDEFNSFVDKIDNIITELKGYENNIDIKSIKKVKESFIDKTEDFFSEDRKLNIGIVGQVKAGKSSFLNTLVFNGMEVLPKASTPKTATLTKIEYSEENMIEIEYYTMEEWNSLEEKSKVDSQLSEYKVAKEIMKMVKKNNVDPLVYIKKQREVIKFDSYNNLMSEINKYVGENGIFTPFVKFVVLKIDKEDLKEISIVDTPGLNDPIASRTDKTKQFIEKCDVVFFLSRGSQFLDKSDMDLLASQLPQKGVKRLILICSKYDEALMDTIYDFDSLKEADIDTKQRLKKHSIKTFNKVIDSYKSRKVSDELIEIIEECKNPIFISSKAYDMSLKEVSMYSSEETNIYENLNYNGDLNNGMLSSIGNIDKIKEIFYEVVDKKEETLIKKSSSFVSDSTRELNDQLNIIKEIVEKRINTLEKNDKEQILNLKKSMTLQINNINSTIENIFGELNLKIEKSKVEQSKKIRDISKQYEEVSEKQGVETKVKTYTVSTSKWYNPLSWGTSRTEYYTYDERYYYLDVADTLENLRCFAKDAINSIEYVFSNSLDIISTKRKLLNVIIENFDTSQENYDPAYFKLIAEKSINSIELPLIKLDIDSFLDTMSSSFSGEIRNSNEKSNLKMLLSKNINKLFEEIHNIMLKETSRFKEKLSIIKDEFLNKLLQNLNEEFNIIIKQYEDKENEIKLTRLLLEKIDNLKN